MWKTHASTCLLAWAVSLGGVSCTGAAVSAGPKPVADGAAAPGRVEGARDTLHLGIGLDGVIKEIRVAAGDMVSAGQVLAIIDREDLEHEEFAAAAALQGAQSRKLRLVRGARDEARRQAAEETKVAAAMLAEARLRFTRVDNLVSAGATAAADRDQAKRDFDAADARARVAEQALLLAQAQPLPEELQLAEAEISEAQGRLRVVRARRAQGTVVAPYDATILKVHVRAGESVTPLNPTPVLTIADLSRFRIRAEVDERDLRHVIVDQPVTVYVAETRVADGRVSWVAPVMGRKNTRTGDPSEKADRDVREVLVDLTTHQPLVIDQRVTVRFHDATNR